MVALSHNEAIIKSGSNVSLQGGRGSPDQVWLRGGIRLILTSSEGILKFVRVRLAISPYLKSRDSHTLVGIITSCIIKTTLKRRFSEQHVAFGSEFRPVNMYCI